MHTRITMRRHHIVVKRLLSHDCWSHGPQRHATPSSAKLNNLWQTGPQRHGQPKKFSHVRLLHLFCYCTMSAGCHSDFSILLLWKCLLNVIRIGYCTYSLHPDRNVTGRKVDTKNTCYLVHVLYILTWSCVLVVPICAIEPNATDIKSSDSPKSKRDPTYLTKYFYRTTKYHSSSTKYTSSTTNYYEVLLQYYKVLSNTTKYYKVLLRITKDYSSTTKYWTFSNYCACHEKWHLTFTKYCTCHKKWHSTFTKYCACHEKVQLDLHQVLRLSRKVTLDLHQVLRLSRKVTLNLHQVLRLPRTVTLELHQVLRLPRKVTLELHQVLRLPRKVTLELHQVLRLARKVSLELHQVLRLPRKVTLDLHQLLRLPHRMTRRLDHGHIWNVISNARSNKCHPPNSPHTAPATQNDHPTSNRNLRKTAETSFPMRGRSENVPRMIRSRSETVPRPFPSVRNPPRNRGYFSRSGRAFCIEKYNISRSGYLSKFHQVLRLPRKVTLELHQVLRLPRKVTLELHQVLRLPRKVTLELHQVLRLPRKVTLDLHQLLRLPRKVTLDLHQLLRLPHRMTRRLDARARSNKCHPPNSPHTAPATQNDHPTSGRNLRKTAETSFPMRGRSDQDPITFRDRSETVSVSPQPATQQRLLFALRTSVLYWKIQHFALRLAFQISPSTAPTTKSDTWTSPSTAPTTPSDTWTSPSTAPATKSDTWTSPSTAPTTQSDTWPSPSTAPTTKSDTWPSPTTAPATQNDSQAWSSSHMKRPFQCEEQQMSPAKLTTYCACHAKWPSNIWQKFAENSWNVISNARPIRSGSDHVPRPFRDRFRQSATRHATEVTFRAPDERFVLKNTTFRAPAIFPNFTKYCAYHEKWHLNFTKYCAYHAKWHFNFTKYCACHEKWHLNFTKYCAYHEKWHLNFTRTSVLYWKIQHFALRLSFQISPSTAPTTKSDTSTSPSTAPTTQSDTSTSPSTAPATKSDTGTSPSTAPAPATKSDTWTSPSTAPTTQSDTWTSPSTAPATKSDTWTSPSTAPTTQSDTWPSPTTAPTTQSDTWT